VTGAVYVGAALALRSCRFASASAAGVKSPSSNLVAGPVNRGTDHEQAPLPGRAPSPEKMRRRAEKSRADASAVRSARQLSSAGCSGVSGNSLRCRLVTRDPRAGLRRGPELPDSRKLGSQNRNHSPQSARPVDLTLGKRNGAYGRVAAAAVAFTQLGDVMRTRQSRPGMDPTETSCACPRQDRDRVAASG